MWSRALYPNRYNSNVRCGLCGRYYPNTVLKNAVMSGLFVCVDVKECEKIVKDKTKEK